MSMRSRKNKKGRTLTRQSHGECSQKETLTRMVDHGEPNLRVEHIADDSYAGKDKEETHIEAEECIR